MVRALVNAMTVLPPSVLLARARRCVCYFPLNQELYRKCNPELQRVLIVEADHSGRLREKHKLTRRCFLCRLAVVDLTGPSYACISFMSVEDQWEYLTIGFRGTYLFVLSG